MSDKILVVDDDPAVRKMLTVLLETIAVVLLASTGEEGLRLVAAERPRLMLLDVVMPGMNGIETLAAARAAAPAMTVIMLTGQNDLELAMRALKLGAAEYVTKPFDLVQLKEKVTRSFAAPAVDERSKRGLPWRIVAPQEQVVSKAGKPSPTEAAIARWEGEGGSTTSGKTASSLTERQKEIK
jgi:DNA-binding response OmpR family regulator